MSKVWFGSMPEHDPAIWMIHGVSNHEMCPGRVVGEQVLVGIDVRVEHVGADQRRRVAPVQRDLVLLPVDLTGLPASTGFSAAKFGMSDVSHGWITPMVR